MTAQIAEPSAPPSLEPGAVVAGRYRVLGLIGKGGMGAVYRAEHVHMRKTVALKLLHPEFLRVEEVVQRFEREAIAAGRIEHPNVVAASDFGKLDDGSFYLVLEYVDGTNLRALLAQGPLQPARTLNIARQTTLALGAAHAAGIVHRDLKPDNIMLVPAPEGGERVKVLDFGIARVAPPGETRDSTKLTRVGVVMGTIAYMSPEQATGQAVDERADLYSLGVMLYEMIAGVVPFDAELPSQVLARQLVEPPPPLPPGTPAPLAELVYDLMQKKPEDRPASAQAVLDRLVALTPTPSGRVLPPKRTLPKAALYAAGGGVFLLGVLVALLRGGKHAENTAPSAEPVASAAPSVEAPAPKVEATAPVVTAAAPEPSASAAAEPAADSPHASAEPSAKGANKSGTKSAKGGKAKSAPTAETHASAPPKRRTGPGGIYIPPPSQWFK
jgi:serine/threonine-protein kinase